MKIQTAFPALLFVWTLISTTACAQTAATLMLGSPLVTAQGVSFAANWMPSAGVSAGGLQFVLNYSATAFSAASVTIGPASTSAGKTAYCFTVPGTVSCIIDGINTNALQAGVVAEVSLTFFPSTTSPLTVQMASASASSLTALPVAVTVSAQPLTIQIAPTIAWPTPAAILVGQSLTTTQLNATASVPGSFSYSPGLGTVLPVGLQTLSAVFTPADTVTYSSATATVSLRVNALPATPTLVSCAPASLGPNASSSCTVTLNQAAPAGGSSVTLSNTNAALTVPASVAVAGGSTTGTFSVATASLSSTQTVSITATLNGVSASTTISLLAPVTLTSLGCAPASLGPNASSTCTVTLNQAAPAGGSSVTLSNTNAALTVPASVAVAGGSTMGIFNVTTASLSGSQTANIVATLGAFTQSVTLTLSATPTLYSLVCTTNQFLVGIPASCTVTLSTSGGALTVSLGTTSAAITIPTSVIVPAGASMTTFVATAQTVASGWIVLFASLNGSIRAVKLTVSQPSVPPSSTTSQSAGLHGISCTPKILRIGSPGNLQG